MRKRNIIVISGGFDPLHRGHISYITSAANLRGKDGLLLVGLNSDAWLRRKKGQEFMSWEDRHAVVSSIKGVDYCVPMDDNDNTACSLIMATVASFPDDVVIFANGGDRSSAKATPETEVCDGLGVQICYGVGGSDKANSSSWILNKWNSRGN